MYNDTVTFRCVRKVTTISIKTPIAQYKGCKQKISLVNNYQLFSTAWIILGVRYIRRCADKEHYKQSIVQQILCSILCNLPAIRWHCVALSLPTQNRDALNTKTQPDSKETEFRMASKTPIVSTVQCALRLLSMTGTEYQRQEDRTRKEGRARVTQVLSGGRKGTYSTSEGGLA